MFMCAGVCVILRCCIHVHFVLISVGDPCIKTITKATCDDPNSKNDLVFPLRLPIDGITTLGAVTLVITSAQRECLTIQTNHAKC